MKNLDFNGLKKMDPKEMKDANGGSILGFVAMLLVVGAGAFLGIHLGNKLCKC